jgi:hypothetical protein
LVSDIPDLFDLIYTEFPAAYNEASPGFGRVSSVRIWDAAKDDKVRVRMKEHQYFVYIVCSRTGWADMAEFWGSQMVSASETVQNAIPKNKAGVLAWR